MEKVRPVTKVVTTEVFKLKDKNTKWSTMNISMQAFRMKYGDLNQIQGISISKVFGENNKFKLGIHYIETPKPKDKKTVDKA